MTKVATHATFQGGLLAGQGGDFWTSFASGAAGGAVGLGTENLTGTAGHVTSIGSAMLLGGATAEFTGGEFWKGAAVAGIMAGANDVAHRLAADKGEIAKQKRRAAGARFRARMARATTLQSPGGNQDAEAAGLAVGWTVSLGEPTPIGEAIMTIGTAGAVAYYGPGIIDGIKPNLEGGDQFYYITYTKTHPSGNVYVGRTSGYGNPFRAVKIRGSGHHMNALGYGPAVLSTLAPAQVPGGYSTRAIDPAYWFIRGSEQIQIEGYRNLGILGNRINGIGPNNPSLGKYVNKAIKWLSR